jgi:arginase family enzyme
MDIAELNPAFDQDNRTARLAASLSFEFVQEMFDALN